jgi:integrase
MRVNGASGKRRLRGVEVRERARGGEHRYAYRVRYLNAHGQRKARTFDTPQDAMDFRGRLRLLKRAGDLAALDLGRDSLEQFSRDYWRLYAEVRLASRTAQTYRSLWNCHVRQRLGGMQLRQITPLIVSVFVSELQDAGASVQTVRACLSLLQSMFSRAVEWDRVMANRRHGLTDATLVSVLAYAGLRPQEALALEWRHLRETTLVIEQRCVWRTSDWREWRVRVWQPACEAIGLATITHTTSVLAGKHKTTRHYRGPIPYHLRHSFASLLIHERQHSLVQIAEWLGHSTLTLLRNYAHVIADVAGRSLLPSEHPIKTARNAPPPHTRSNSTGPTSTQATTRWLYG